MDFLKSAVASAIAKSPLAAYTVGDRVELEESIWTLSNATKRDDNSVCSIFTFDVPTHKKHFPLARNAIRKCRTLRHPGVIKVLDTIETETQLHIITERLVPLIWHVRRERLAEEAVKWGLWNIAKTVTFINNDAASVHGCIRLSSIFTSESGEWKLGGLEVLSSNSDEEAMILSHTGLLPNYNKLLPPEVAKGGWGTYRQNPWPAVDAYGYANLISEIFDGPTAGPGQPSELRGLPPSMQQSYKRMLNPNPKGRLTPSGFLELGRRPGAYFQTPLILLTESLDSLGLKTESEREAFVSELHDVVDDFPDDFLNHKILPELLKSVEYGGGGPKVFAIVLQVAAKLSEEQYTAQVLPVIVRLFANPDRALRVCLLDSLPAMIDHLPRATVNDQLFPNITTGFSDLAPLVREQTVKSVLTIIVKLTDRTINGELLKYLAKTSNDTEPGIRTNTTICLGKIAKHLGPNTRIKVLVAAFTRSLRDPFVHARNAAVMALGATVDMFSEDDCASKILPALCPCLLDKEKIVRDQASKSVDLYLSRVRRCSQSMPESALPPPSVGSTTATNGGPRMSTPAVDNSWTGWAISSFTNKINAANGTIQPDVNLTTNGAHDSTTKPSSRSSSKLLETPVVTAGHPRQPATSTESARIVTKPVQVASNDFWISEEVNDTVTDDAWGAMDEEDTNGWSEEGAEFPKTTSTPGTIVGSTPGVQSAGFEKFDDNGEPDFAGWLEAQRASRTSKSALPKGLASTSRSNVSSRKTARGGLATSTQTRSSTSSKQATLINPGKPQENNQDDDWGEAWT